MASSKFIVLIEPHKLFVYGLETLLKEELNCIIESFSSPISFIEYLDSPFKKHFDIIITETSFGSHYDSHIFYKLVGVAKDKVPKVKIIALTATDTEEVIVGAIQAGVDAYILKSQHTHDIISAIKRVSEGQKYFGNEMIEVLVNIIKNLPSRTEYQSEPTPIPDNFVLLTKRELEVLRLVGFGYSNQEIAGQLYIEPRTISTHKQNIIKKLGLKGIIDLVKLASNTYRSGKLPVS